MNDIQFMEEQGSGSHSYSNAPQSFIEKAASYFHIPKEKIPQVSIIFVGIIVLISLFILYNNVVPKKAAPTAYPRGYEVQHNKATVSK